ncbi:MAG: dihydroneopterin aldolase family protein [Methanomassiliicoccales archaeon]
MSSLREQLASKYFNCSLKERAIFEAGIKLGTIYHQFVGTPVCSANVDILERAIEDGVKVQPFVRGIKVNIDRKALRCKKDEYDYQTLTGNMLDVILEIQIENVRVVAEMRYIKELHYPLMFVSSVEELD